MVGQVVVDGDADPWQVLRKRLAHGLLARVCPIALAYSLRRVSYWLACGRYGVWHSSELVG